MTVFEALNEMRRLTGLGNPFSFTFMSYYRTKQISSGIVEVQKAKLRKRGKIEHNSNAEIMEEYLDITTNSPREFYHASLMSLNGQQVELT